MKQQHDEIHVFEVNTRGATICRNGYYHAEFSSLTRKMFQQSYYRLNSLLLLYFRDGMAGKS